MKVTLFDYTGAGFEDPNYYAMGVLRFAKSTRLDMKPELFHELSNVDIADEDSLNDAVKDIEYISKTIPASWEFVHYNFLIQGVTRAFTHQFVRTRTASFAQQTMRVLDVGDFEYGTGPTISDDEDRKTVYEGAMLVSKDSYFDLVAKGAKIEDARGILPTNILTNIAVSMNLRTFVELCRKRSGPRVQGEYRDVLEAMKYSVLEVHDFVRYFVDDRASKAAESLEHEIGQMPIPQEDKTKMYKLLDIIKTER